MTDHWLARLVQLGIPQARHFGHARTKFRPYLAATEANLALPTDKIISMGDPDTGQPAFPTSPMIALKAAPICSSTCCRPYPASPQLGLFK